MCDNDHTAIRKENTVIIKRLPNGEVTKSIVEIIRKGI